MVADISRAAGVVPNLWRRTNGLSEVSRENTFVQWRNTAGDVNRIKQLALEIQSFRAFLECYTEFRRGRSPQAEKNVVPKADFIVDLPVIAARILGSADFDSMDLNLFASPTADRVQQLQLWFEREHDEDAKYGPKHGNPDTLLPYTSIRH
jgi:hypothetical protein